MDEFGLIDQYLKPLSRGFAGSLSLTDDAAVFAPPSGRELVVTTDAISKGVHFIGNEDAALIARKLLRTNLSDLAAMGAAPLCYFLNLMLPHETRADWVARFALGLREDQDMFGIHLAGGDTISTQGTLSLSVTAMGSVTAGSALKRGKARAGDIIYVSGTLGDSALGLAFIQKKLHYTISEEHRRFFENRYYLPQPRLLLGQKLIGIARAAMDISDGLVQDLEHLCKASEVSAAVERHTIPLSAPAQALVQHEPNLWDYPLTGGDDYELLFTAPENKAKEIEALARDLQLPLTAIGKITSRGGVQVVDEQGRWLPFHHKGFQHF